MTDLQTYHSRSVDAAETAAAFSGMIARTARAVFTRVHKEYVVYRDTHRLSQMSDSQLSDIGVSRGEIDRAIRYGRHG